MACRNDIAPDKDGEISKVSVVCAVLIGQSDVSAILIGQSEIVGTFFICP